MSLLLRILLVLPSIMMPAEASLLWDLPSSLPAMYQRGSNGTGSENFMERGLSRHKRATGDAEYSVDIEISFQDPVLQNEIRTFINTLTFPIALNDSTSNIKSINVTTACSQANGSLQCTCEDGYVWPSAICQKYTACVGSTKPCSCITVQQYNGLYCQLKLATVNITLSLSIIKEFTPAFKDPSNKEYKELKAALETAFSNSYKSLPGFEKAEVIMFRPGSIVADYTIVAEPVNASTIQDANNNLVTSLGANYTLGNPAVRNTITGQSTVSTSHTYMFVGDRSIILCKVNVSSYTSVDWFINGTEKLQNDTQYSYNVTVINGSVMSFLTINSLAATNSGTYKCIVHQNSDSFVAEMNLKVLPITVSIITGTVRCNSTGVPVLSCCTDEGIDLLSLTCYNTSGNKYVDRVSGGPIDKCRTYNITASPDQCLYGNTATYQCACTSANGASQNKDITVTLQQTPVLQINSTADSKHVSEGKPLFLECSSNVDTKISWRFSSGGIDEAVQTNLYNQRTNRSSILHVPRITKFWNGTIICAAENNPISVNKSVIVYSLTSSDQINVNPVGSFYVCNFPITFTCCVDDIAAYASATINISGKNSQAMAKSGNCFVYTYTPTDCAGTGPIEAFSTISNRINDTVTSGRMTLSPRNVADITCNTTLGIGSIGDAITVSCETINATLTGNQTYECSQNGAWNPKNGTITCFSASLNGLDLDFQALTSPGSEANIPNLLVRLSSTVTSEQTEVTSSPRNIQLVLNILSASARLSNTVEEAMMQNFLTGVNVVVDRSSAAAWSKAENQTRQSSELLKSVEEFARKLDFNGSISIRNNSNVQLAGVIRTESTPEYKKDFSFNNINNLTGKVAIGNLNAIAENSRIVSIAYATLKDVLPLEDNNTVNGLVMTTVANITNMEAFNISMTFRKSNVTLNKASCVFWNLTTNNWDSNGCRPTTREDDVICECDHLTSFSILMSYETQFTKTERDILDYITYIGVGISMLSLVICIFVEVTVWKSVTKNKTSYMRHVCLVNIAVSLLVADIWFIIGAALAPKVPKEVSDACVAVTFFTHFFYLSLFFWMLTMGLILFYRLVYVLHDMSKTIMMTISFVLGYGCPLVISVITVASTQPFKTYTADEACWLNTKTSNAFIAFVVPALIILLVNTLIVLVVVVKILRPSIGDKPKKEEKSALNNILKCIVILTPLLGLTWGFGIGTLSVNKAWIHGIFAGLNSLQGLFILLFGCLLDKKVREALLNKFSLTRWVSQQTRSTNTNSSDSPFSKGNVTKVGSRKGIINPFGKKGAYNISSAQLSSSSDMASNSYSILN
ncbi:adhesion G protein-coupled receptor F5-like isoform X2 [Spea bombifrons]|nr:adhesion G protein-coupled receptor F5-like isoform X2 [Spea bombifrons]XP_053317265.1 adhesion G protein-coupled receptor F5-like isoform X2 [Spea bombifrons]